MLFLKLLNSLSYSLNFIVFSEICYLYVILRKIIGLWWFLLASLVFIHHLLEVINKFVFIFSYLQLGFSIFQLPFAHRLG